MNPIKATPALVWEQGAARCGAVEVVDKAGRLVAGIASLPAGTKQAAEKLAFQGEILRTGAKAHHFFRHLRHD